MDFLTADLIYQLISLVAGFLLGLYRQKPGYLKGKNLVNVLNKAFEDDVLTPEEIKQIYEIFKPPTT